MTIGEWTDGTSQTDDRASIVTPNFHTNAFVGLTSPHLFLFHRSGYLDIEFWIRVADRWTGAPHFLHRSFSGRGILTKGHDCDGNQIRLGLFVVALPSLFPFIWIWWYFGGFFCFYCGLAALRCGRWETRGKPSRELGKFNNVSIGKVSRQNQLMSRNICSYNRASAQRLPGR